MEIADLEIPRDFSIFRNFDVFITRVNSSVLLQESALMTFRLFAIFP